MTTSTATLIVDSEDRPVISPEGAAALLALGGLTGFNAVRDALYRADEARVEHAEFTIGRLEIQDVATVDGVRFRLRIHGLNQSDGDPDAWNATGHRLVTLDGLIGALLGFATGLETERS